MEIVDKLSRDNIENLLSLTSLQEGMLYHYISDEFSDVYHEILSLTIIGDLKLDLLQKSWNFVIENNEMLRTVFRWQGIDKPIQVTLKKHQVLIQYTDFTNELDKDKAIENIKLNDLSNRIDITSETLRIYLCKLENYKYEMIVSNHHILYDGWSNGIVLKELMETYTYLYNNRDFKRINKTKFSEFIKYTNNSNKQEQKKYWINYLKNLDIRDDMFTCEERDIFKRVSYKIDVDKSNKIKNFAKENKVLLSSVLYGTWGVLIQNLSDSKDVLFGTTVSGRTEKIKSIDNMVGLFINTIPLRVKSENDTTFISLISDIDLALIERKDFESTPLTDIKEHCGIRGNEDIFNSIVTIENYPLNLNFSKDSILYLEKFSTIEKTNYNITLEILAFNGLQFKFIFNSATIDENIVESLCKYLERLLDILLANPNMKISEIDLLSEEEKNQILYEFNNTEGYYPKDKTIQELFEEQVEKRPDNVAVIFEDEKLTYKELNEKSNSLARLLRSKGIKADSIVGIMVERSLEMIIGIMGILKAGGAYLPIDPNYPKERIEYMLDDSETKILLSRSDFLESIEFKGEVINLFNKELFINNSSNLQKINNSTNLAYIIYTSGSTGLPKGVMVEHRSVVNTLTCMEKNYPVIENDVYLFKTTYTFDVSVTELFGWFIGNGTLAILSINAEKDINKMINTINKCKVTHINFVPSMMNILNEILKDAREDIDSLKYIFVAGEEFKKNMAMDFLDKVEHTLLENIYGPTETTIYSTKYAVNKNLKHNNLPIGKPFDNTYVYIINKNNMLVPIGIPGELCISGDGLARGYVNRPELTAEKFVDNPFKPNTKMYKTGDLARWLPDGNIEFLGRIDNQVKIRGFRIELGEIENRLLQHEDIKEVAVVVKENKEKEKYICAYVVSEKEVNNLELRSSLKTNLPDYMIPSYFIQIDEMPLTSNGKLSRKALPEPKLDPNLSGYEAPRNEVEEKLVKIWSEVLGIEIIGINDNFFELGGNSISALRIINKARDEFKLDISIKILFSYPNIKEFSRSVLNLEKLDLIELKQIPNAEYYPLSYNQKRLWIINQLNPNSTSYNVHGTLTFNYVVNEITIKKCLEKLIERHESLRTGFKIINNEIVQYIITDTNFAFEYVDISLEDDKNIDKIKKQIKEQCKYTKFNLYDPPLIRAVLLKLRESYYELIISMHHIIVDGWSLEILRKEFHEIYNAYTKNNQPNLEDIPFRYRDFAVWQNDIINNSSIKMKTSRFWTERIKNGMPTIKLQPDYIVSESNLEGASYICFIPNNIEKEIKKIAIENNTSLFMVMFSAYNLLLSNLTGQNDVICSVINAGRELEGLKNIVGFFVNAIIIINHVNYDENYITFLNRVTSECLDAFKYAIYPVELIFKEFGMKYPDINMAFNMHNILITSEVNITEPYFIDKSQEVKYDIELEVNEYRNGIELKFNYRKSMYMAETIEYISKMYLNILSEIGE